MPATFVTVTKEDFDSLLRSDKGWNQVVNAYTKEIVYVYPLKRYPHIEVRVYSSVRLVNGMGREVGKDAIRVCAVDIKRNKGIVKNSRINRTTHWKDRLKQLVLDTIAIVNERAKQGRLF